jgi:hypothetical protein
VVTECTGNYLSRMMVAVLFPFTYLLTRKGNTIWFFKRGGNDLKVFYKWLDDNFAKKVLFLFIYLITSKNYFNEFFQKKKSIG